MRYLSFKKKQKNLSRLKTQQLSSENGKTTEKIKQG